MKRKIQLLLICSLAISFSAEAQFFKKLVKKAENAAERTILNRTDREVSKGTDNAIDSITKGDQGKSNKKGNTKNIGETEKNLEKQQQTQAQKKAQQSAMQKKMAGLLGGSGLDNVPDVYEFSYRATMKIVNQKDEVEMIYWFEPDQRYFGSTLNDEHTNSITVMDLGNKAMVMFNDDGKQKTAMKIPAGNKAIDKAIKKMEEKSKDTMDDAKITPIANKTILGYDCKGYQITTKDGVSKMWITDEAPVGYLGGMANTDNLPSSVLPIGENTMFMEMQFESAKKKRDNFSMVCTELIEKNMSIVKEEYATMGGF
ncbi:DUF4412 domain-containing protein [Allomuricauda sp. F6463D]|uniref:DUF4412 domain-containing protein n=1 Tax=Allomuricauda sp. F6463D TaxID=2926409 RepID=UPI001FF6C060|nr:DUF4412 domain-containing protein [Muricauda sp. F6463D]MCK0159979.1 DUF4412 domain-containing protein [Muricauda sp. F6463D]